MTTQTGSDDENKDETVVTTGDLSSLIRRKDGSFRIAMATGSVDTSPSGILKFALFRLGHDLHECRRDPLPMIAAEPLCEDTNLFEWHANLVGPPGSSYEDVCFHFVIKIPDTYPAKPPKITICSYFEHPNVFGRWICLDMLEGEWVPDDRTTQTTKDVGYGWTPAYTMQSILVQLQAFLFDAVDTTGWAKLTEKHAFTSTTMRARTGAKSFKCQCGHTGRKPWPEPLCWKERLRYMVPGREMADVAKTKQELWNFLETVDGLVVANEWPRIAPIECGSFFSWTLLPWYDENCVSLIRMKQQAGVKSALKRDCKVIRALVGNSIRYLNQKPKPAPHKAVMLRKMYVIESAIDIAVNNTYASKHKMRKRGYWQWSKKILFSAVVGKAEGADAAAAKEGDKEGGGAPVAERGEGTADGGGDEGGEVEEEGKDEEKEDEKEEEEEWSNFPVDVSQQIEALYCRWRADLRRPGVLVEIANQNENIENDSNDNSGRDRKRKSGKNQKNEKNENNKNQKQTAQTQKTRPPKTNAGKNQNKNKVETGKNNKPIVKTKTESKEDVDADLFANGGRQFGIITKPKGYHWHVLRRNELTDEEKKCEYEPYGKDDARVRVMLIDPARVKHEAQKLWMTGPQYARGAKIYVKYRVERSKNSSTIDNEHAIEKVTEYTWLRCVILKRYYSKAKWHLVVHPMPTRLDINRNSQLWPCDALRNQTRGVVYKAYVRGGDGLHYAIDVMKFECRCIETQTVFKIMRCEKERSTTELWDEILRQSTKDVVDVPWKKAKQEAVKAWPWNAQQMVLDPARYIGRCAFIDLSMEGANTEMEPWYEDGTMPHTGANDGGDDERKEKETNGVVAVHVDVGSTADGTGGDGDDDDETKIADISFPEIGQKVPGRVVKVVRFGAFVDIGYEKSETATGTRRQPSRHAFLHVSQMKCPPQHIEDRLAQYLERKREDELQLQTYEEWTKREFKRKKKRRKQLGKSGGNKTDDASSVAASADGSTAPADDREQQQQQKNNNSKQQKHKNQKQNTLQVPVKSNANNTKKTTNQKQNAEQHTLDGGEQNGNTKNKRKRTRNRNKNKSSTATTDGGGGEAHTFGGGDDEEDALGSPPPPKPADRKPFSLPRSAERIKPPLQVGEVLHDLWVYDRDQAMDDISLTQFKPLSSVQKGDTITGQIRSVLSFAAFVDVGAETDAFLHKTALEEAYKNRIIFDCRSNIEIGDALDLIVTNVSVQGNKLEVSIDMESAANHAKFPQSNRLQLPDDFDESKAVYRSIFGLLPDDINDVIFQFGSRADLYRLRTCCKLFERIIDNKTSLRFEIEELKCFHSKKTFRDEILGFGVKVERYPNTNHICNIDPKLDLLSATSYSAFTVRMNVWKEPFSHWLPVYINKEHGQRSLAWAKRQICEILNDPKYAKNYQDWNPYYVLKIIPTLMNTMVVKTMKGELHESIVALEGYTMFYHMLLAMIVEYPFLQTFIDEQLTYFNDKSSENEYRNKKKVPSLGELIALLSASNKFSWRDISTSYLRECFDRNAKWILTANKVLLDENHPKKSRLQKSFNACQVSLKLCMFHVVFLRLFRYSARSGTLQSVRDTKEKLDAQYGRPTYGMRELLQKNVKRIKKIRSWGQFFEGIGVATPSENEIYDWLVDAMRNSETKGYHKPWYFQKRKPKNADTSQGGLFNKLDDMADAWSAKQFGSDVQLAKGIKKKKMSTTDQMIASF